MEKAWARGHYNIKKFGNKSELIKRVEEHMFTVKYMQSTYCLLPRMH